MKPQRECVSTQEEVATAAIVEAMQRIDAEDLLALNDGVETTMEFRRACRDFAYLSEEEGWIS
jgi:hypothetical protein